MASKSQKIKPSLHMKNTFDVAIVGAGLKGLLIARCLEKIGLDVILIDAMEDWGGMAREISNNLGTLPSQSPFVPHSESHLRILSWVNKQIAESETDNIFDEPSDSFPVYFHEGQLKAFLGFGDSRFSSLDELSYYNNSEQIPLNSTPEKWVKSLENTFSGTILKKAEVTSYEVDENQVNAIIFNGNKKILANKVVHCISPSILLDFLPAKCLSPSQSQQLAKTKIWTCVRLHYCHQGEVTKNKNIHFLMENKGQHEALVGQFFHPETTAEGSIQQNSVWLSWIPLELAEEDEHLGAVVRNMKKQIKRVYKSALSNLINEKITIHNYGTHKSSFKVTNSLCPPLSNLYVADACFTESRQLMGSLSSAKAIVDEIQLIHSATIEPPSTSSEL